MVSKLWYKFCFAYLGSPFLVPLLMGLIASQIVIRAAGRSTESFVLAVAVIIVTNWTTRKLVTASILELVEANPGVPLDKLKIKVTGKEE